jgi:ankyrin repeat protein
VAQSNRKTKHGSRAFAIAILAASMCFATFVARQFRQAGLDHDLSIAVRSNDYDLVVHLLREGADPDAPAYGPWLSNGLANVRSMGSWTDQNPIRETTGNLAMLLAFETPLDLLPTNADLVVRTKHNARNEAMFSAIKVGDNATVISMLKSGFPVDERDSDGRTALIYAVNARNRAATVILMKAGANVNARTHDGNCVIANALTYGDSRLVPLLLNGGATPNVQDGWGQTPLALAAERNDINNVQQLLQHGADPNLGNPNMTALDRAIRLNNTKMVSVLKAAGAKPSPERTGAK